MNLLPKSTIPPTIQQPAIQQLVSERPKTPNGTLVYLLATGSSLQVLLTLANIPQVEELVNQVLANEPYLNPVIAFQIQKLRKGACKAIADRTVQQLTNAELIAAAKQQRKRHNRIHENYSYARVMDLEVVKEREVAAKSKVLQAAWQALLNINPDIFVDPPAKAKRSVVKAVTKKEWNAAIKPFFQISLDIFQYEVVVQPVLASKARPVVRKKVAVAPVAPVAPVAAPAQYTRSGRQITKTVRFEAK